MKSRKLKPRYYVITYFGAFFRLEQKSCIPSFKEAEKIAKKISLEKYYTSYKSCGSTRKGGVSYPVTVIKLCKSYNAGQLSFEYTKGK